MSSKVKIKFGHIEFECEGSEEFISTELVNIIKFVSEFKPLDIVGPITTTENKTTNINSPITGSTSIFANKTSSKSGRDLALAASAKIVLIDLKESFSRDEILAEMKSAKSYYKGSYGSNLSETLRRMVKAGELNELSENNFAISVKQLEDFKSKI